MSGASAVVMTTFIEGVLVHGKENPVTLLVPCQHAPHRGLYLPPEAPWAPGYFPPGVMQALVERSWRIPFRFHDPSKLPLVFDERTSRLPNPWLLRVESLENQQRLYLTYLLRTKSTDGAPPEAPLGGAWMSELDLATQDIPVAVRKLCEAALKAVRES